MSKRYKQLRRKERFNRIAAVKGREVIRVLSKGCSVPYSAEDLHRLGCSIHHNFYPSFYPRLYTGQVFSLICSASTAILGLRKPLEPKIKTGKSMARFNKALRRYTSYHTIHDDIKFQFTKEKVDYSS